MTVMSSVYDLMEEAVKATPRCAIVLYATARDAASLYDAIVPVLFADVLKTVTRMRLIHYNNCMYIAHQLGRINRKFRSRLVYFRVKVISHVIE